MATIVIHASGYRVKAGSGHHWATILTFPEIMGKGQKARADYFNACRAKRNVTDYDRIGEISDHDLEELLKDALEFKDDVINWLHQTHPNLI